MAQSLTCGLPGVKVDLGLWAAGGMRVDRDEGGDPSDVQHLRCAAGPRETCWLLIN